MRSGFCNLLHFWVELLGSQYCADLCNTLLSQRVLELYTNLRGTNNTIQQYNDCKAAINRFLYTQELLTEMQFDGENTPIIVGSALMALEDRDRDHLGRQSIINLVDAIDRYIEVNAATHRTLIVLSLSNSSYSRVSNSSQLRIWMILYIYLNMSDICQMH